MYLSATNIHKTFGKVSVLKGLDLEVAKGEIVAIVGASGAGKTTLLQIIGTLARPDSGKLFLNGKGLTGLSDKEISRIRNQEIGFVFQFHHLLPEFTALENACMPAYIMGKRKKEAEMKGIELLEYLGLSDRLHHKPDALSGGEQQRVAVARALINNPAIILADEPSGNLDSANALDLHELFLKLRNELGQTFVIVTHNKSLAAMADRTLEMRDGVFI